jgi:hypothetical protein
VLTQQPAGQLSEHGQNEKTNTYTQIEDETKRLALFGQQFHYCNRANYYAARK